MLFNAAFEQAFILRKATLSSERFLLKEGTRRLTNVSYAGDMLLVAKRREELGKLMVLLIGDLQAIGLDLNASKAKIITNDIRFEFFITTGEDKVSILEDDGKHKHLCRYIRNY